MGTPLENWVDESARLTKPDRVVYCDGSAAENKRIIAEMLGAPVYGSSWPSRIPFPTSHPLWSGNFPTLASGIAKILSNFDAVFARLHAAPRRW